MARKNSLEKSRTAIEGWFDSRGQRVFHPSSFTSAFRFHQHSTWGLAKRVSFDDFVKFFSRNSRLGVHEFAFPANKLTVFTWGEDVSIFETVLGLGKGAYLSHFTAAFFHEITEQVPKTIFITVPQPRKRTEETRLTQEQINLAFSKEAKATKAVAKMGSYRVARLTGMETHGLGIVENNEPGWGTVHVTDLERTLIDMVVRPNYAGGIHHVLEAFRLARGRVSSNRLAAFARQIDFVYPYHQSIGFMLERAGYDERSTRLFRRMEKTHDFFLTHGMGDADYSVEWRLYFPKGL